MSVTQVPPRPIARGSLTKLWLAVAALIAIAFAVAWAGKLEGVSVKTLQPGSGAMIGLKDGVFIEYTGKKADGTVFDTTEGRGPAPLLVGQVVPGFTEALLKMQKGGHYEVFIPGAKAYGPTPPPGSPFGPNEDLYFDVRVVEVMPNAADIAQQMQQQQMQQQQQQGGAPGQ